MDRQSSFSVADLFTSCALVLLLVGFSQAIMGCGGGGGISEREMNLAKTQVRGIIQGLINYSPGNNEWYPGLNGRGEEDQTRLPASATQFAPAPGLTGYDPAFRFGLLVRNNYFSPDYLVSPIESNEKVHVATLKPEKGSKDKPGEITVNNYSFAVLELKSGKGRKNEWRTTVNSRAAIIADRNIGADADAGAKSLVGSPWSGVVGFNDNHVTFEMTNIVADTKYGNGGNVKQDNLFKTGDPAEGDAAKQVPDADALLTYNGPSDGGVNQKP